MATFYALYRHESATAGRRPRLRRHRLPAGRRGGTVRGPDAGRRAGRRAGTGRPRDVAAQPVPGAVRPGAGGAVHVRRRVAEHVRARAGRCRRRRDRARGGPCAEPDAVRDPAPVARHPRIDPPPRRGSASSTRPRSTTTARTAATRPWPAPSRSARTPSSPRSPPRSSWAAAAPPSRPVASGRRWPTSPPSPTTSSATPTNPSPARSRTASSSRATRSRRSRR